MTNSSFSPALLATVALGSAAGGMARYTLTIAAQPRSLAFPLGTLVVNMLGCLLLGVFAEAALSAGRLSPEMRVLLISGFCGGFTTFSTFSFESIELMQSGAWTRAALYVTVSVATGLGAIWLGSTLVRVAAGRAG
ncbi:MAG: fluoride efflux transporter CrcB [Gemmatimonadota bacterium]